MDFSIFKLKNLVIKFCTVFIIDSWIFQTKNCSSQIFSSFKKKKKKKKLFLSPQQKVLLAAYMMQTYVHYSTLAIFDATSDTYQPCSSQNHIIPTYDLPVRPLTHALSSLVKMDLLLLVDQTVSEKWEKIVFVQEEKIQRLKFLV